MIVSAVFAAVRQLVSAPLRRILWRSIALAVLLLGACWFALTRGLGAFLASHPISADYPLADGVVYVLTGFGLFIALGYLMPTVSAVVAGFFVDDAALIVEKTDFPADPPGLPLSFVRSLLYGLRFAGLSLLVNLIALALLFVPGVNVAAFFIALTANAYLLGREYFEMAAVRFSVPAEASRLRREHQPAVFVAGMVVALLLLMPVLNLATPLFAIALMVHLHKRVTQRPEATTRALRRTFG